jgi:hypothetical protein
LKYQRRVKSGSSFCEKSKKYTDKEKKLIASLVNLWRVRGYPGNDDIVYSPLLALSTLFAGGKKRRQKTLSSYFSLRFRDAKRVERGGHRKQAADGRGGKK